MRKIAFLVAFLSANAAMASYKYLGTVTLAGTSQSLTVTTRLIAFQCTVGVYFETGSAPAADAVEGVKWEADKISEPIPLVSEGGTVETKIAFLPVSGSTGSCKVLEVR